MELNGHNSDAFILLAQVQSEQGAQDRAIASCQRSIQENPLDVRSYMLLGVLEETRGNWQKGQELYERALQVAPDDPLAANNLAYSMLDHGGDVDVAFGLAQTARRGMPDSAAVADTLAWAYYQKSAYSTAIELLKEALAKSPNDSTYHYHIGMAYEKNKDQRRAIEHLQRALSINPNYAKANEIRQTLAALGTS